MAGPQSSLLDLFESERRGGNGRRPRSEGFAGSNPAGALNPFRKQSGECAAGCGNERQTLDAELQTRVFWCHVCGKKFCWNCFLEHSDFTTKDTKITKEM